MKKVLNFFVFFLILYTTKIIAQTDQDSMMRFAEDYEENVKIYEDCKNFDNKLLEMPPLGKKWSWGFDVVTLNGKKFTGENVGESYMEQDGWAYIHPRDRKIKDKDGCRVGFDQLGGYLRQHYWLYDTYRYWNGKTKDLYDKCIPSWIESLGLTIDFSETKDFSPNIYLDENVKSLIKQRNCDFAVTILNHYGSLQNMHRNWNNHYFRIIIVNYDKARDVFSTRVLHCGDEYYFKDKEEFQILWEQGRI